MSDRQMFDMAVIEHLGQSALLGQKLSPLEIFERGWQAAQLAEAEKKLESSEPVKIGGWSIDNSTGTDILMLDSCSVIEGKYAHLVMRLLNDEIERTVQALEDTTPQPAPDTQALVNSAVAAALEKAEAVAVKFGKGKRC